MRLFRTTFLIALAFVAVCSRARADAPPQAGFGALGAANAAVTVQGVNNPQLCEAIVEGTFVGTITWKSSTDNGNSFPNTISMANLAGGAASTTATTTGTFVGQCSSGVNNVTAIQAVMTSYTSGTAYVELIPLAGLASLNQVNVPGFPPPGSGGGGGGTVNQGTSPWTVGGSTSIAPQTGAAPSTANGNVISYPHCLYSSTTATPASGQTVPFQCDSSGRLLFSCGAGCSLPFSGSSDAQTAAPSEGLGILGFNGTTWDRVQVDGNKYLKINCVTGCAASGNGPCASTTPSVAFLNATATGNSQIVALSGTTKIYVCELMLASNVGAVQAYFNYGTGTNCATGTAQLSPATALATQYGWVLGNGAGTVMSTPSGQALCINLNATVAAPGVGVYLEYVQQ